MRVIISGFEPIWGVKNTPSGDLAALWRDGDLSMPGAEIKGIVLPQTYGESTKILCTEISGFKPHIVLMYGATQKNDPLRMERFAINVEKSPMGDNTKIPVKDRPIVIGGPPAYESTLPIPWLIDRLSENSVDSKASYFAGTHVCNSILYGVMHYLSINKLQHPVHTGFMHVPFPNSYGVIEDEFWSTATFQGIVKASMVLLKEMIMWYSNKYPNITD